jgi:hypothetical protein
VPDGQFASTVHCTQRPSSRQVGVDVPAQSTFVLHCTQAPRAVLQCGFGAEQLASLVHPFRQWKPSASQMGAAVPQSEFAKHCTHAPSRTRHRGADAGQSAFVAHSTHCCVVELQILLSAGQSEPELHPTHAPVDVLQSGEFPGQPAFEPHEGWHLWSRGQQAGVAPPQSAFDVQTSHDPLMQWRADAGQLASLVHSTQPSAGSHCWFDPHWFAPPVPQSALPVPTAALLPPHATTIPHAAAMKPIQRQAIVVM